MAPLALKTELSSAPMPLRRRKRTGTSAAMPAEHRARRLALCEQVRLLHQQGESKRQIGLALGLSPWLVRRFVQAETFPERAPKLPRPTILTPFEPLLHEHWQQGERTTTTLFWLLQAAGYTGSIYTVRHWVQGHRHEPAPRTNPAYRARYTVPPADVPAQRAAQRRLPSARQLVWLLLNKPEEHDVDDQPKSARRRWPGLKRKPQLLNRECRIENCPQFFTLYSLLSIRSVQLILLDSLCHCCLLIWNKLWRRVPIRL